MSNEICPLCLKPILDGEPIYTIPDRDGGYRHYDCWDRFAGPKAREKIKQDIAKMKELEKSIKRMMRNL